MTTQVGIRVTNTTTLLMRIIDKGSNTKGSEDELKFESVYLDGKRGNIMKTSKIFEREYTSSPFEGINMNNEIRNQLDDDIRNLMDESDELYGLAMYSAPEDSAAEIRAAERDAKKDCAGEFSAESVEEEEIKF